MEDRSPVSSGAETRQKSCNACVKAKRGCDKLQPECSRCREKEITCVYAKRPYSEAFPGDPELGILQLDPSWGDLISPPPLNFLGVAEANPTFFSGLDAPSGTGPDASSTLEAILQDQAMSSLSMNMEIIRGVDGQLEHQKQPDSITNVGNLARMADLCERYEPWQVYDPNSKIHFIVEAIKRFPASFATDGHTPWIHRYLYRDNMETSMRTCLTTSSLYSNMNDNTKASVLRILFQSPAELKQSHQPNTPRGRLARTQALFLYQIMCLFDGDITLRAQAEKDMPILVDWLGDLCKVRDNLEAPPAAGDRERQGDGLSSWERWIFAESVRRTIIMAYSFIAVWTMMRDGDDEIVEIWEKPHRWTLSKQLWEAPSSFDFFRLWRDKPHHVIEGFNFEEFLKTGRGEHVDEFAKILMVAYIGPDEIKQWFADTGSSF